MSKRRVYEVAKELGVSSKDIIDRLEGRGCDVKNHMSVIPDEMVDVVINEIKNAKMQEAMEEAASTPEEVERRRREEEAELAAEIRRAEIEKQKSIEAKTVYVDPMTTVKELTDLFKTRRHDIINHLMRLGIMNATQKLDLDVVTLIGQELGFIVKPKESNEAIDDNLDPEDSEDSLKLRPPIVTVMGHVDHGKTTLLDNIRKANVTAGEAGGITQHIGAYQVSLPNQGKITFLDTPGHEAFTAMRAHGAAITDIAILVVAADDGVMPQTIEAIDHANAAEVPIIVAINKVDKPAANIDRVKKEMADHGVASEDWGGEIITVPISAKTGQGVDELLEMINLVAEMKEFKANPNRGAVGVVVEARKDIGRGAMATVLVQKGTLKIGDSFLCGATYGKVRSIVSDAGAKLKKAGPSTPVVLSGFNEVPEAGERFYAVKNERDARQMAETRKVLRREQSLLKDPKVGLRLEDLFKTEVKEVPVIVKADVKGSVIAVKESLEKLSTEEVKVRVIHAQAGALSENDVMLASASNAIIIGFNVRPSSLVEKAAEREGIEIRTYNVIYHIHDDIRKAMVGLLAPILREEVVGRAEVRETFKVPKVGLIAGCFVHDGKIVRNKEARVLRDGVIVYSGRVESLRRFKDDVTEVRNGYECGIGIEKYNDVKVGDYIEVFEVIEEAAKL